MATARAFSNIAFIKYWGNQDDTLRIPVNPSLSMNLDGLYTETSVAWSTAQDRHQLELNGDPAPEPALERAAAYLDRIKTMYAIDGHAMVVSHNNFPTGVGIASSASAFAALALAATKAASVDLSEKELSALARLGSGSASRSVPSGFVEWLPGETHDTSYAVSIAAPNHWSLVDLIAIVDVEHKAVGSTQGHKLAPTSALQGARVHNSEGRLVRCKDALLAKDFAAFADVVELDSTTMHAVMMTSHPPLFYWQPASVALMQAVMAWRAEGLDVCYTMDAGPNVHCLCLAHHVDEVRSRLEKVSSVQQVLVAKPGGPATVIS